MPPGRGVAARDLVSLGSTIRKSQKGSGPWLQSPGTPGPAPTLPIRQLLGLPERLDFLGLLGCQLAGDLAADELFGLYPVPDVVDDLRVGQGGGVADGGGVGEAGDDPAHDFPGAGRGQC